MLPVLCRYTRQWNPVDGLLAFRLATIRPRQAHSRPPWPGICVLGRRCGRARSQYALVAGSIVSFRGAPRRRVVVSFPLSTSAAHIEAPARLLHASDLPSGMTGAVIDVNGGQLLTP